MARDLGQRFKRYLSKLLQCRSPTSATRDAGHLDLDWVNHIRPFADTAWHTAAIAITEAVEVIDTIAFSFKSTMARQDKLCIVVKL